MKRSLSEQKVAPYGSWKSPITSDLIISETINLGAITVDEEATYWVEVRPQEAGRYVLVRRSANGTRRDVTPPPFNVRTRVHEYGGGSYLVSDGVVYFSNFSDQRLYRLEPGAEPLPITPEAEFRFADGVFDRHRGGILCVREDHTSSDREAVNTIVRLETHPADPSQNPGRVLVSGNDFYAYPRLSPDGKRLSWMAWDHPNMPWDSSEVWVAGVEADGSVVDAHRVAGEQEESIFQPSWSPDGLLYFVSDRTGWWNLYRWKDGKAEILLEKEAEFGLPHWLFGAATYGFASPGTLLCTYIQDGITRLARLDLETRTLTNVENPYTDIWGLRVVDQRACFCAGSTTEPYGIVELNLQTDRFQVLRKSSDTEIDPAYLSIPQPVEFPTENGLMAYGFFYPPKNRDYRAPAGEKPPLMVISHGGPTGASSTLFDLHIQYWTSRGFAVLDVNYGGSTGYGREYRNRLNGQWGVVDVDDCTNGALYLVRQGLVDEDRLAITGGSAGGYTTLCALTFRKTFKAGASHFGIGDLVTFVSDTHKFESRYLDKLVGPYPEKEELYRERSPIYHTERISCPMILFQGLEDEIVPPNQAEMMYSAVNAKGLPVAYLSFEGEQHGFRQAKNIKRALDAELYFYSKVFNFELADPVEPEVIENLKG
jgi:dipeptidyl aminopeptidase/acylaminoacyl peptidase